MKFTPLPIIGRGAVVGAMPATSMSSTAIRPGRIGSGTGSVSGSGGSSPTSSMASTKLLPDPLGSTATIIPSSTARAWMKSAVRSPCSNAPSSGTQIELVAFGGIEVEGPVDHPQRANPEDVGAIAAQQAIGAAAAVEDVVAGAAAQHVGAGAARQPVGTAVAGQIVGAGAAAQHIRAREAGQHVVAGAAVQTVGVGRAGQPVITGAADAHDRRRRREGGKRGPGGEPLRVCDDVRWRHHQLILRGGMEVGRTQMGLDHGRPDRERHLDAVA